MAFTPNSRVYLLDTPLDNSYKNELYFSSVEAQYNYFFNKKLHAFEDITYQRKDNKITVDAHIDSLWNVNYVMYQNTQFNSKYFYAFITRMEYVSPRTTDIYIETDVFQTWLFECELKPSFVIREHVSDDTIGKHLIDEQLEIGEYVMSSYSASNKLGANWNILAVSDNSPLGHSGLIGNIYGQVVTGLTYFPFPNTPQGVTWLKDTIKDYTDAGKADAIVMIFTVPKLVIKSTVDNSSWFLGYPINSGDPYGWETFSVDKQLNSIDGYIPKNNKMFSSPYKFLYVTNNDGLSAQYRYEDFPSNTMEFMIYGSVMPNPKVMFAPYNYRGEGLKYEYGLILSGFPMCSWTTDTYAAWLSQNVGTTAVAMLGSVASVGVGIATGNVLAIGGGALSIAHQLSEIKKASIQPDQAKGQIGSGALMFGTGTLDFFISHMNIKAEYAKRIDDFLTMFGYKVNALKVPETHSRENWNYIQTIDVNIEGTLPTQDMNRLKKIYDDGVTLWHNPNNFLNYSVSNNII